MKVCWGLVCGWVDGGDGSIEGESRMESYGVPLNMSFIMLIQLTFHHSTSLESKDGTDC